MSKIKLRRGILANLPTLDIGEPAFTTDTTSLFIGSAGGNVEIRGLSLQEASLLNTYNEICAASFEPSGFPNLTDSVITYTLNTRTITVSGTFVYFNAGNRYEKTSVSESVQHGTSVGLYFIYYTGNTLYVSANSWSFRTDTPVCAVYYNGTAATTYWAGPDAFVIEERHGFMPWSTHQDLHHNVGTYVKGAGFALSGTYAVATGTGGLADVSYGVDSGTIVDEDIETVISALSDNAGVGNQYPVFYKTGSGSEWRWSVNNVPLLKDASNNIVYNQNNAGTWGLTAVTQNGRYVNYYIGAIPFKSSSSGTSYRFIWFPGQSLFTSLTTAQAEDIQSLTLDGLPFTEFASLWQVTMRRESTYSTDSGRSRIEAVKKIVGTKLMATINGNPTDHNNLSNRNVAGAHLASAIATDTTNFNNILNTSDINVQLALETIDDHTHMNTVNYYVSTNVSNAYSITTGKSLTSLTSGLTVVVKINASSTGAITLNVDAIGANACKRPNGQNVLEVYADGVYTFVYNGTNFILQGEISTDNIDCGTF